MQIGELAKAFNPSGSTLGEIRAIITEGGQHLNETQIANLKAKIGEFNAKATEDSYRALELLSADAQEQALEEQIDAEDDELDEQEQTNPANVPISEAHPITAGAIASIQAGAALNATTSSDNPGNASQADVAALITGGDDPALAKPGAVPEAELVGTSPAQTVQTAIEPSSLDSGSGSDAGDDWTQTGDGTDYPQTAGAGTDTSSATTDASTSEPTATSEQLAGASS